METLLRPDAPSGVVDRAAETLQLMHKWGYAPTLSTLARDLLGGEVQPDVLEAVLQSSRLFRTTDGFVHLADQESLVESSKLRWRSNRVLNGDARALAESFAKELATLCPYVRCIALSGSVASGGYRSGDDIDFDLIVQSGTKYVCYLAANLIGLKYSWRFRKAKVEGLQRTPFLPKIMCINVVWTHDDTRPFVRQDAGMAFELLHCQPLVGANVFGETLARNHWLGGFFPQLLKRTWLDSAEAGNSRMASFLRRVGQVPVALGALNRVCRAISWMLYTFVQASRKSDAAARARMEYLKTVKYPYEVFQD